MKPITHAKIKYRMMTATYIIPAIYLAAAAAFWGMMKRRGWFAEYAETRIDEIWVAVQTMVADRDYETKRVYRFHKLGYELVIKSK